MRGRSISYLLLLPLVAIPGCSDRNIRRAGAWRMPERGTPSRRRVGLLIAWLAGVVAAFSLISGKQPHYLVPLVPLAMILLARLTAAVPERVPAPGAAVSTGGARLPFPTGRRAHCVRPL